MWRWTEIDGTLNLVLITPRSQECLMTFIAVRCPHCQSEQIVKRGKTSCGTQRYLCQNTTCTTGSFLLCSYAFCLAGYTGMTACQTARSFPRPQRRKLPF